MTVSAPLQNSLTLPSGQRTTVDMRLRVELNSHTLRISYSKDWPCALMNTDFGFRVYIYRERHAEWKYAGPAWIKETDVRGTDTLESLHQRRVLPRLDYSPGTASCPHAPLG